MLGELAWAARQRRAVASAGKWQRVAEDVAGFVALILTPEGEFFFVALQFAFY